MKKQRNRMEWIVLSSYRAICICLPICVWLCQIIKLCKCPRPSSAISASTLKRLELITPLVNVVGLTLQPSC